MIRVPDKAAGGKGKCPKCGIRITVPKKSTPKPAPKSPGAEEQQFFIPGAEDQATDGSAGPIEDDPDAVVELEPATFEPGDLTSPPPVGQFPFASPQVPSTTRPSTRRLKKKKRGNQSVIIGAIVVLAILLVAGIVLHSILTSERLAGDFTAATSATLELPAVTIAKSQIRLPPDDVAMLLKKLELAPLPMLSNSMQVDLTGTPAGLKISVAAGAQSQFYRVTLNGNADVKRYLAAHLAELEELRLSDVDKSATDFFVEYQKVLAKKSTSDNVAIFRDTLAIPALLGGFGYFLAAEHGRGLYRCVYEDPEGGLYFLLPAGATFFKITGRPDANGHIRVPADFNVSVEGEIAPMKKPTEQPSSKSTKKPAPKSAKEAPEMEDEKMDGKN